MINSTIETDVALKQLQENGLVLKVVIRLQDHLSHEIRFSLDKKKAWLGQRYLFEILEKKFGKQVTGKNFQNPRCAKIFKGKTFR